MGGFFGIPIFGDPGNGGPSNIWPGMAGPGGGGIPFGTGAFGTGNGGGGDMDMSFLSGGFDFSNFGGGGRSGGGVGLDTIFAPGSHGARGGIGIGGINNGFSQSGAWSSGGFNGTTPWNNWSGVPQVGMPGSSGPFGVPQPGGFPANGIGSINIGGGQGLFGATGGAGVGSSGGSGFPQINPKDLEKIYGKGVGTALAQFLNSGAGFNPAVAQAQINQAMPLLGRGEADIMNQFGNLGLGYSSTAALGFGDFESQFFANLEGVLANEYQQSVSNYINVLTGTQNAAQQSHAQGLNWQAIAGEVIGALPSFF